jgi:antitoxin ParD1/3/4
LILETDRKAQHAIDEMNLRCDALRAHLAEGASRAANGDFVANYDIEAVIAQLDAEE